MNQESDGKGWRIHPGQELQSIRRVISRLDTQTVVVLLFSAVAVILQMKVGDRGFFRSDVAPMLELDSPGLASWGWWFSVQGVLGFLLPVLILRFGFKRRASEIGLGAGDWRFASLLAVMFVPFVIIGTWVLSDSADFQSGYPHFAPAALDWSIFAAYESLFLFYWIGWEYLWRGFILFGTARVFGVYAIFIQALPFAILHFEKPFPEAFLSILGGVALGALVWRARSFWIAVPIHAFQMLSIDFFCSLRIRSGVTGIGPAAMLEMIQKTLGG